MTRMHRLTGIWSFSLLLVHMALIVVAYAMQDSMNIVTEAWNLVVDYPGVLLAVLGVIAIVGGIGVQGQNVAFLVALAFAVAASANLPTIVYSLYWRSFTTRGALWSMYGGLGSAIFLIVFSPVISGAKTSMLGDAVNFAWFPLENPGIVSIPLGFLLGWLGSITSKVAEDPRLRAEMEVRSLTGHGAEAAVQH